jgi:hypothetical protein
VQDLASGRQRDCLRRLDRPPHVIAADLPVLSGDGDHAAAVESLDVRARQREVDGIDLDAGHQFRLVDRLLDRFDCRLEVDDDTAFDPARLGNADAGDVEAAILQRLADDADDRGRPDVEADNVFLFTRHRSSCARGDSIAAS